MDEHLFYIEQHIEGIWENNRYSLIISSKKEGEKRLISLINKETIPNKIFDLISYINKKGLDYTLTMIDYINRPMITKEYKLHLDMTNEKLRLSVVGATWDFEKLY